MNVKSFFTRFFLLVFLAISFWGFTGTSAYALPPKRRESKDPPQCIRPWCSPQSLPNGNPAISNPLDTDFQPQQFVTDVTGASSDPEDIVQLVDDAVTVWRAAFKDIPEDLNLEVGWANFGVLKRIDSAVLSGNLVGGVQKDCDDEDVQELGLPAPTELPSVSGGIVGVHICGSGGQDAAIESEEFPCKNSKDATILFNSEPLQIKEPGKKAAPVKLFLDTTPFQSSAFGPIETVGSPSRRLKRSFEFSDPYVVDLFTVALHEVGHALGYAEGNGATSEHIGELDIPDVLSPYIPFATRKCPSRRDVEGLLAVGPTIPIAGLAEYSVISYDPCGNIIFNWLKLFIALLLLILLIILFFFGRKYFQVKPEEKAETEETVVDEGK